MMELEKLLNEVDKLHQRNLLSDRVAPDYFEPGMMEFLDQSEGIYNEDTGEILLRFESKGTRYEGRTEHIERISVGDIIFVTRDYENLYNRNNFVLLTERGRDVGYMPADLCNVVAPLYDAGKLEFLTAKVSYVEPLSKRSRYAKQAILFVELKMKLI